MSCHVIARTLLVCIVFVTNAAAGTTLCTAPEQVVFSCAVARSRIVSVCRSDRAGERGESLAYRFGRPGRVELVFPTSPGGSFSQFRYAHYFRSQVDRVELNFTIGDTEYGIHDDFEGDAKPATTRGVHVTTAGRTSELSCIGPVVSRLVELESRVPCDADNALSNCH